ncbi:DUF5979 domain-containing protein [Microbacterium sp. KR10-403]|uniref:DUF5979 domain-containing protein n=1 Tax=Microbacterium sp. KR10-403 TaxID=3158581 RepID=UPI0032E48D2B
MTRVASDSPVVRRGVRTLSFGTVTALVVALASAFTVGSLVGGADAASAATVNVGSVQAQMANQSGWTGQGAPGSADGSANPQANDCTRYGIAADGVTTGTAPNTGGTNGSSPYQNGNTAWVSAGTTALVAHGRSGNDTSTCQAASQGINLSSQSTIGFSPRSVGNVETGTIFNVGRMVHINRPVYNSNAWFRGDMNVQFLSTTLSYQWRLHETTNNASPPEDPRNNDLLDFTNQISQQQITVGGLKYTLVVFGFTAPQGANNTCNATVTSTTNVINSFSTVEGTTTYGCLYASLEQVRTLTVVKQVAAPNGAPSSIPVFTFDASSTLAGSLWGSAFSLTPTATGSNGSASITNNLAVGQTVNITERAQTAPWSFTSLVCTDGVGNAIGRVTGQSVTFDGDYSTSDVAAVPITCTYTNTYTPRATLTLQKQVVTTGQTGALASPFNWTLTARPQSISGQGAVSGEGQTGQTNTTPNPAITNQSVIAGTYALSETADGSNRTAGYVTGPWTCFLTANPTQSVPVTGGSVTLANQQNVTCHVTNTFQTGRLEITKTVTTSPSGGYTGGTSVGFTARYTCDGGITGTVTVNPSATDGQAGTVVTVDDLPAGANCTVTETAVPSGSEGLANASWVWNSPPDTASVVIPADDAVRVNIANSATQRTGVLRITKTVEPANAGTPTTGYTGGLGREFTVSYTCTLGGATTASGTTTITPGTPAEIPGVPATSSCVVTETAPQTEAGDFAAEEYDWADTSIDPGTVTVPASGAATVAVTNTFERHLVSLTLAKVVTGAGYTGTGEDFTISYDCGKTTGEVTLAAGGSQTVQVPARNVCRVQETTPSEDLLADGYVWDAPTYEGLTDGTVTIPADGSATVTVTNHNRIGYGRISVTKDIANYGDRVASGTTFTIHVACNAPAQGETADYAADFDVSWPNPQTPQTPLLPIGTACTVSETSAPSGSDGLPDESFAWSDPPASQNVTVPATTTPEPVTVTNDITRVTAPFTITKTVNNTTTATPTADFTGTWSCTYAGALQASGSWSAPAAGGPATLDAPAEVYVGSVCTVTENDPAIPVPGDPSYSWGVNVPGPTTVVAGGASATVTNVLDRVLGSFSVTKSVVGGAPGDAFDDGDFGFHYSCVPAGGGTAITGDLTMTAGSSAGPGEGVDIPAGSVCTLTETSTPDAKDPYSWDGVSFSGEGMTDGTGSAVFTIPDGGTEIAVTATNTISPKTVDVSVQKSLSDPDNGLAEPGKTFSIWLVCDGVTLKAKDVTVGGTATWAVPLGVTCHAVEAQVTNGLKDDSFAWGSPVYSDPVQVEDVDGTYSITVANSIVRRYGTIGLQKTFDNNGFNGVVDPDKEYTGTWSCQYGTDDPVTGTWTGVAGEPATLTGVPAAGILLTSTCTATEDDLGDPSSTDPSYAWADPQITSIQSVSGVVADNVMGVANALIRHTGSIDVTKHLTGATAGFAPGDDFDGFTVGVACTRGDDQRLEREVKVQPGGAAVTLIDNVPAGWSCTVTELSPPSSLLLDTSYAWGGIQYEINGTAGDTATIVADETAHAVVTNTISRVTGTVQITKQITTPAAVADGAAFTGGYECVYRDGESGEQTYSGTWSVTGSGEATLTGDQDIPLTSSCTVTETALDDADLVDGSWTWQDPEYSDAAVIASSAQPAALTVTNSAQRVWAGLQIHKTYDGVAAALPDGLQVGGAWTCTLGGQTVASGRWATDAAGGSTTVAAPSDEAIPATADCAVQEDTLDDADLTDGSFTWNVPTFTPDSGEVATTAGDTGEVTVHNSTSRVRTEFAITKDLVAGAHTFDQNLDWMQTFTGEYSCRYAGDDPVTGEWGPVAHDGVVTIPDILVGSECSVTAETRPDQPVPGAPSFVWLPADLGSSVVAPEAGAAFPTITVTNTVQRLVGAFTLSKTVTGDTAGLVPGSVFTFTWQCRAQNGDLYPGDGPGTVELEDGEVWNSPADIAAGADCTVTEQEPPAASDPSYAWSSSLSVTGVASTTAASGASVQFTTEDDADILVAAVNELTRTIGSYTVAKTSDPASGSTVEPGQTITYTVTVTPGDVGFVDDVVVTDDLSDVSPYASLQVDSITASQGTTSLRPDALEWDVGTVRAGTPLTLTYQAIVKQAADGVTIRNAVTADGEVPPTDCTDCSTTHVTPAWTLSKSSDPASGSTVQPGDVVTYTLTARNTSDAVVTGAEAIDDLSDVLSASALVGDLDDDLQLSGTTLTWTIPTLQPDASASVHYRVRVNADAADTTLRNVVDPAGPGGTCDGCTTTAIVPPVSTPTPTPTPTPEVELPVTGGTIAWGVGAAALVLVLLGAGLVVIRRRRES